MRNEDVVLRAGGAERGRVFAVALAVISLSAIGFVLALIFQWPSDFVLGGEPDSEVTLEDVISGTVTSIPLAPFVVLVVSTLLVRTRRWWGTVATVVLTLLGGLFVVGGLGEITSENANVPKAVLVIAGVLYVLLGLTLLISGALALLAQWRGRTSEGWARRHADRGHD